MRREDIIRAIAGSLVVTSLALGWWWHPAWLATTVFVGLNLLQSALLRLCPPESLLAALHLGKA